MEPRLNLQFLNHFLPEQPTFIFRYFDIKPFLPIFELLYLKLTALKYFFSK